MDQQKHSSAYLRGVKEFRSGTERSLRDIQREQGLDAALHYYYLKQTSQKSVKDFRKSLEIFKTEYKKAHSDYQLLIVAPPVGIAPKWTKKQLSDLTAITSDAGFSRFDIFHKEMSSVVDGALQLRNHLKSLRAKKCPIFIVSFSHGSALVRFALDQLQTWEQDALVGWVNFSGLVFGSPYYPCSAKRSLLNPSSSQLLRSFSSEQRYFTKPVKELNIPYVSFLGCQALEDLRRPQKRAYRYLQAWGPNDGLIPFSSYDSMPGVVVPLWGQSHFMDFMAMSTIFQKTFCYITSLHSLGPQHFWNLSDRSFVEEGPVYEISL